MENQDHMLGHSTHGWPRCKTCNFCCACPNGCTIKHIIVHTCKRYTVVHVHAPCPKCMWVDILTTTMALSTLVPVGVRRNDPQPRVDSGPLISWGCKKMWYTISCYMCTYCEFQTELHVVFVWCRMIPDEIPLVAEVAQTARKSWRKICLLVKNHWIL